MDSPYIYVFGYESPIDYSANRETGGDAESTAIFRIIADSEEAALKWGWHLSKWYLNQLFEGKVTCRWDEHSYSSWIEKNPDDTLLKWSQRLPAVRVGEYPSVGDIRRVFSD
jgi:hypothetical protein